MPNIQELMHDAYTKGKIARAQGKYVILTGGSCNTPWCYTPTPLDDKCAIWSRVFDLPGMEPRQFVPRHCMECWKVVIRPRNFKELMQLERIERELGLESKCGIEVRPSVSANYGGYFYNHSIAEGLSCKRLLTNKLHREIFNDVPGDQMSKYVFLKRACTEYERDLGDSSLWQVMDKQLPVEDFVLNNTVVVQLDVNQSEEAKVVTRRFWMSRAHSVGDMSYVPFNENKALYPPYRTYTKEDLDVGET